MSRTKNWKANPFCRRKISFIARCPSCGLPDSVATSQSYRNNNALLTSRETCDVKLTTSESLVPSDWFAVARLEKERANPCGGFLPAVSGHRSVLPSEYMQRFPTKMHVTLGTSNSMQKFVTRLYHNVISVNQSLVRNEIVQKRFSLCERFLN